MPLASWQYLLPPHGAGVRRGGPGFGALRALASALANAFGNQLHRALSRQRRPFLP